MFSFGSKYKPKKRMTDAEAQRRVDRKKAMAAEKAAFDREEQESIAWEERKHQSLLNAHRQREQERNAKDAEEKRNFGVNALLASGVGRRIDYDDLNSETFRDPKWKIATESELRGEKDKSKEGLTK